MKKQFFRYVFQNTAGMIGISVYILADTFFISVAAGPDGITVLNLALPIYGIMFALGSMVGVGFATRYAIHKAQGRNCEAYFSTSLLWNLLLSLPFLLAGLFCPQAVLRLMGGDAGITALGTDYTRIFLVFAPFFMMNYTFSAFVRNDNGPTTAMIATLAGSIYNIIFDFTFMFVFKLGLAGAALATGTAPILGILINLSHVLSKKSSLRFRRVLPSVKLLFSSCPLGIGAFIGELSSAVTTTIFNFLILGLVGNIGVSAYGVIANLALVAMAIFNGISQGAQPLISRHFGEGHPAEVKTLLRLSLLTTAFAGGLLILLSFAFTDPLIGIFNSSGSPELLSYAHTGLRLYFPGFLPAGINIMLIAYYAATDRAKLSFAASLLRGVLVISLCSIVLSALFAMNGLWLSFLAAEVITLGFLLLTAGKSIS